MNRPPFSRLAALSFLHALGPGFWMMSLGTVLVARGWGDCVPLAFALGPLAALVSPWIAGVLADKRLEAQRLLRWLCWGAGACLFLGFRAIADDWGKGWFFFWHGLHSLFFSPTWSLVATVVFAHIPDPARQYPLLRVWATMSWVVAGLLTSFVLHADASPVSGMMGAAVLWIAGFFTFRIPPTPPGARHTAPGGWRSAIGLDALGVFRHGDLRVFLIATTLLAIPMAAYFPYAPQLLRDMGQTKSTVWMSSGQVAETISMLCLGWLVTRLGIKQVMLIGLFCVVLRYALMAIGAAGGGLWWVYPGLLLHGLIFSFYYVAAQIFLELQLDASVRARAQALVTMVQGGIGALAGVFLCGYWHKLCIRMHSAPLDQAACFWGGLCAISVLVFWYFAKSYGRHTTIRPEQPTICAREKDDCNIV